VWKMSIFGSEVGGSNPSGRARILDKPRPSNLICPFSAAHSVRVLQASHFSTAANLGTARLALTSAFYAEPSTSSMTRLWLSVL
jgi:hypothetical protein